MTIELGKKTVASGPNPTRILATSQRCHAIIVHNLHATDIGYLTKASPNLTTGVNVTLAIPAGQSREIRIGSVSNPFEASDYWVHGTAAQDFLVTLVVA